MYFRNKNGDIETKENFSDSLDALNAITSQVTTPQPKESNACDRKLGLDTILLIIALFIVSLILWFYDDIFGKDGAPAALKV